MNISKNRTCIICSFLPLDNFQINLWNKISSKLKEKKIDLVLLSGYDKKLDMPVVEIPFSLKGFYEKFEFLNSYVTELSEDDIYLIERDIFWNSDSIDNYEKYIRGLFACKSFYTAVIEKIKPSFVFVWGYLLPQSIIFKSLLDEKKIPSFFLERGFFSGSFMIEDILYAELKSGSKNLNTFKQNNSFEKYYKLKDFYNNYSNTKYPENQDLHLQNFLKEKKQNGFKIITFYGMHDVVIFPEDFILSKKLSGIFNYTTDAVAFLTEIVNKLDNVILVIKPHPNDSFRYDDITGDNIYVTKNFINKNLIELTDVIIVTNSTIQYEAIFSEKPIITLGNSPIIDFNATYSPKTKEELYSSISQALERKDLSEKIYNSKIFIECVLDSHTYFYDSNNFGKDLNNLSDFIERNAEKTININNLTDRLIDFEKSVLLNKVIYSKSENENKFVHLNVFNHLNNNDIISLKNRLKFKIDSHKQTIISSFNNIIQKVKESGNRDNYNLSKQITNQNFDSLINHNSHLNNIEIGVNKMTETSKNELLTKAEELIEEGNLFDARKVLDTMLILKYDDVDALNDLAVVEILDENYSLAFEYLKKVLSINPENVVAIDNMKYIKDKLLEINASKSENYEPKYEKINCPFCRSDKSEQYRISADIVKCKNCQTVYLRTRLTQDEMRKLYQSYADEGSHMALPKNKQEILNSPLRRDYLLSEILEYIQPDGILLDIGCGWGAFLDNARSKGFEPRGIELTKKCVRFANEELRIKVSDKFFEDIYFDNESISVVTMIHVLEHIPTPTTTLKKIFQILKPNGLFAGIIPNIESYCSQTLKEQWYWLDPNYHYVHYSSKILKKHLENYGFEILKLYTTTGDYGKENLINIIMNVEKISRETSIQRLAQIEKSYMGEEIRFIAKKKL